MSVKPINSPGLATPQTYSHVVVATGTKTVFIAARVARTPTATSSGTTTYDDGTFDDYGERNA